jgi:peptidoglycan-N-acetylglucosamine deacetylase
MQKVYFLCLLVLIVCFSSIQCKKYGKKGYVDMPGIALTFDDDRVDNWYTYIDLLDSLQLKATFYISSYAKMTPLQKQKLHALQNRGHEIAYHTRTHANLNEYMKKYKKSQQQMMQEEIVKGLAEMNKDGFYPKNFAYPFGAHNPMLDEALHKYFKSVRALNGSTDYSKSLTAGKNNYKLYGFGLDQSSNHSDVTVKRLLEFAKTNNNCAVLVAHDINTPIKLCVTKQRLLALGKWVKNLGLKSYTISQISEQ